jgi:hemoglobin
MASPSVRDPSQRHDITAVEDVELLVRRFYQAVIPDPLLGPIFEGFGVDWSVHIPKLVDFWANRLLGRPGFSGNVAGAHVSVFDRCPFGRQEVERWLELWRETLDELFIGPTADLAKTRALGASEAIMAVVRRQAGGVRFSSPAAPTREPGSLRAG